MQAVGYVSGFITNKLKALNNCQICKDTLPTSNLEPQHIFPSLKVYDNKTRLKYSTLNFEIYITQIYDLVKLYIDADPQVNNIVQKMTTVIS